MPMSAWIFRRTLRNRLVSSHHHHIITLYDSLFGIDDDDTQVTLVLNNKINMYRKTHTILRACRSLLFQHSFCQKQKEGKEN